MKISTVLDQIDLGSMALPEFQRGYVWNRDQVRGLMHSLYKRHPVGSLLVWLTQAESAPSRGDGNLAPGIVSLILDGQQRMTSLYGIVRGKPPTFFDGNSQMFTGLYFNLDDEIFEFYLPLKMEDSPTWINVTEIMQKGPGEVISRIVTNPQLQAKTTTYINRLNAVSGIKDIDLHVEQVTGEDKSVDVVVDIFNRVNSGGTKLSKGDLALAKICACWPQARAEMKSRLDKWQKVGFFFKLEWLLRCINTVVTGEALFSALKDVDTLTFKKGMEQAEKYVDSLLDLIAGRLGLDHDRVLGSRYSFPLLARYLHQSNGRFPNHQERDKVLFWYIHTFLWGRYAGSTETVLNQDLDLIKDTNGGLDRLITQLRQVRGHLKLQPDDFKGWSRGTRFYPLLYMMTRVCKAKDWDTGIELTAHLLGKLSSLQIHHIFPKALLYKQGYSQAEANAIANFTFLTQETNLMVSDKNPEEYLEGFMAKNPGAVESHWIPTDRMLWKQENYLDFLAARRELLAAAANQFLESLVAGTVPEESPAPSILGREALVVPGRVESEEEDRLLQEFNGWIVNQGLPPGEYQYELTDPTTGEPLANLDLAWPSGLQEGFSQPVTLLIGEGKETIAAANRAGYRVFTNPDYFRDYVLRDILAMAESA